jgi:hypothetical protein
MMAAVKPIHFIQTSKHVTIIFSGDAQMRRVDLDMPHSANLKPSWYGESVGHCEGDTLMVDTIGLRQDVIDNHRTPHTEKLHVAERYKLIDEGKTLQVTFRWMARTRSINIGCNRKVEAGADSDGRRGMRREQPETFRLPYAGG